MEVFWSFLLNYSGVCSLGAAIIIGCIQIYWAYKTKKIEMRQDERDEKRRQEQISSEAVRFIQKYNTGYIPEINLLPLCVIAYKYNPVYSYSRKMYRDFCCLPMDVKCRVLEIRNVRLQTHEEDNFYSRMLEITIRNYTSYCPGDVDPFYEDGKYLERALLNHGQEKMPLVMCECDKYSPYLKRSKNTKDMDFKAHIINLLVNEPKQSPFATLRECPTTMGIPCSCLTNEILMSYLCCVIAEQVNYLCNKNKSIVNSVDGYVTEYMSYNGKKDETMEDCFLLALLNAYYSCLP